MVVQGQFNKPIYKLGDKSKSAFKHYPWLSRHQISGIAQSCVPTAYFVLEHEALKYSNYSLSNGSLSCLLPYTSCIHNRISPHTLHPCTPAAQKCNGLLLILPSFAVFLLFSSSALCTALRGC